MARQLADPGSFRDPDSRVVRRGAEVLRVLSARGLADWEALTATELFGRAVGEGKIVGTERVEDPGGLHDARGDAAAAVLRHELIPFVTYPYEWPVGMLRDAALLQLELMLAALDEGVILKDASPYNFQWRGASPVFIDVGSFERLQEGEAWAGYRQFCMLFLYPLMLTAYRGIPHQPWLRGALEGISPAQCRRALSRRDRLRRGVLTHVVLHSRLESRQGDSPRDVGGELRSAGFRSELIRANVRRLQRIVRGLRLEPADAGWSGYRDACTYSSADSERKAAFVREQLEGRRLRLVWDLGCNDGHFSRLAAEAADTVVAMDSDARVIERLYSELRDERHTAVTPLVVDVCDPSPALGWAGAERQSLTDRGRPDLLLCLALVHHVVISANVPMAALLSWLAGIADELLIEFVDRDDPMVQRLLARKRPGSHPDYDRATFERLLHERFNVARSESLGSGVRTLYSATPRVAHAA
jgi:hypothetical protein